MTATRFPEVLYEEGGFPVWGVLLDPADVGDAELEVIVADIPSYLDQDDDDADESTASEPRTWFVSRGLWAWRADPEDDDGRCVLVPASAGDEDAFRAVLLEVDSPWRHRCEHHPGLVAAMGVPNPTTPDGHPYTYLCQDCTDRYHAECDAWDETYLRLQGSGLPQGVVASLLGARSAVRLVPDQDTVLTVSDLDALPVGALVYCRARTWERVTCDGAAPAGGLWSWDGVETDGQDLTRRNSPVHPLIPR